MWLSFSTLQFTAHNPESLVRSYVPKFETLGFGQCVDWLGLVLLGLFRFD